MPTYVAHVEPRVVRVIRVDEDRDRLVDTIPLPASAGLRLVLIDAGWRPTGRKARGGPGAIFVIPAEDGAVPA